MTIPKLHEELLDQIAALRTRLEEAEEIVQAIRSGEVDALVVSGLHGDQIFTLQSAEHSYRVLVEAMQEGAVTLGKDGLILYGNPRFAQMLGLPQEKILGSSIFSFLSPPHIPMFQSLMAQEHAHSEITLNNQQGLQVPAAIALSPLLLDNGMHAICLVATDLTIQQQREQEIRLIQQLQVVASEATNFDEAIQAVLKGIVTTTSWIYGEAWTLCAGEPDLLECRATYSAPAASAKLASFRQQRLAINRSLVGTVWTTQEKMFVPDVRKAPGFARVVLTEQIDLKACIMIPVLARHETVAVLNFFTTQENSLDEHFIRLTATVAAQIGSFILRKYSEDELAKAHQELEQRVQQRTAELEISNERLRQQRTLAEALRDTALALNSTLDLPDVLQRILTNVERVVRHETADIMLIEGDQAYVAGSRGYETHGVELLQSPQVQYQDWPILAQLAQTQQPIVMDENYPGWMKFGEAEWRASYAGLPIQWQDQVIGFLNITSLEPGFFTPERVEALQIFANQAALAIQNARLYQESQTLAAMQERERLARDLHDAVSQTLFSASIVAETLPRQLKRDPEKAMSLADQLQRLTRGAQAEMRTLLLELRPATLYDADLKILLIQLVEAVKSRKKIEFAIDIDPVVEIPADTKLALYRITQEALNNITKHSQATQGMLQFKNKAGWLELVIADQGRGFDVNRILPTNLGIKIMRERAETIGGVFTLHSQPGQGTEIRVTLRY